MMQTRWRVMLATAGCLMLCFTHGDKPAAAQTTTPKTVQLTPTTGAVQVLTITHVNVSSSSTSYFVVISAGTSGCTITVATMSDALQLREQIASDKTTQVRCSGPMPNGMIGLTTPP